MVKARVVTTWQAPVVESEAGVAAAFENAAALN